MAEGSAPEIDEDCLEPQQVAAMWTINQSMKASNDKATSRPAGRQQRGWGWGGAGQGRFLINWEICGDFGRMLQ